MKKSELKKLIRETYNQVILTEGNAKKEFLVEMEKFFKSARRMSELWEMVDEVGDVMNNKVNYPKSLKVSFDEFVFDIMDWYADAKRALK